MDFLKHEGWHGFGRVTGFVLAFALFTAILHGIRHLLDKTHGGWQVTILITFAITLIGFIIRRLIR